MPGLVVDLERNRVFLDGADLRLPHTEHRVLMYLAAHEGCMLTYRQILQEVWGEEYWTEHRMVRWVVWSLRKKLGESAQAPRHLVNHARIGFMFLP